ncbi:MAG TPA: phytanoyl-CoA dioxygenase family protein [Bryobacteraceae bacterium]|jgi:ectoine hydroxylase-related dioxygenase (phytanoyl-CoA dioxygenase family)|nr:phytanoyl-CoA dioxygenase family protein [Bryobacteraceae bacterium]
MALEQKISELQSDGFCVLKAHFPKAQIQSCRDAFWPILAQYLQQHQNTPNRGPHRYFLPMPFDPPCFTPEFFFDPVVLQIVRSALGERIVADQWGCDVCLEGSQHQGLHVDFQRPLFPDDPCLVLPPYILVVSFGLIDITLAHGPIEIAPATHRMPRHEALAAIERSEIVIRPVPLESGDVLIRHPWAFHRGTPNLTRDPRPLLTIRYVRRWYNDDSRDVNPLPNTVWESLTTAQQALMRFPRS